MASCAAACAASCAATCDDGTSDEPDPKRPPHAKLAAFRWQRIVPIGSRYNPKEHLDGSLLLKSVRRIFPQTSIVGSAICVPTKFSFRDQVQECDQCNQRDQCNITDAAKRHEPNERAELAAKPASRKAPQLHSFQKAFRSNPQNSRRCVLYFIPTPVAPTQVPTESAHRNLTHQSKEWIE